MLPQIELRGVTKEFGKNIILDKVDLKIPPRKIFGIIGESGSGKTTLAKIYASALDAQIYELSAVSAGKDDIKKIISLTLDSRPKVLFLDEIHRFNKAQQDALLPYVESAAVILIGATTQNPYFEVNSALVSRSQVYLLQPLAKQDLLTVLKRALEDKEGYGGAVKISVEALDRIASIAGGDARIALNALELAVLTVGKKMSLKDIEKLFRERSHRYDHSGEDHYNTISAFIKSLRGSDPDAALLWLFKMLVSGEEPRFLFRRMMIFASEDIGNADPRALQIVVSAWQAFEFVGLPEGEFFLAHACIYLAQAPKSNAVTVAKDAVKQVIHTAPTLEVPLHLRNAPVKGMRDQGYHKGYQYPHDDAGGVVKEHYFPMGMQPQDFYAPTDRGFEAEVRERLKRVREIVRK